MAREQLKDRSQELSLFRTRAWLAFAVSLVLSGVLLARYFELQIVEHETYRTRSEDNRIQIQALPPTRGLIFDRRGVPLAENRAIYELSLVPEHIDDLDALLTELSLLVELDADIVDDYERNKKNRRRPFDGVTLKSMLSEREVALLAVNRHRLPGVAVNSTMVRRYPFGELFAHALGSVRRINEQDEKRLDRTLYAGTRFVGKRGAEKFYESSLLGEPGYQQVEIDAHGRIRKVLDVEPARVGQNITLQLDSRLQIAASAALGDRRGAVVAIDPNSGGILALVSQPGYDPNLFVTGISQDRYRGLADSRDTPLFNRAVNGQYAPGSTFKPVVGLAGVSQGAITWDEIVEDNGFFQLPGQERVYRDWSWTRNNAGGQGKVDLTRAIYRSSNIYFYDLATRMDPFSIASFARQFGLGSRTAIDVADASAGLVPDPTWKRGAKGEIWYPGDSVNYGIGQGDLLVTPLQLATMTAIIARRGQPVQPRLLLASDEPLEEFRPAPSPAPILGPSADDWERMVDAMEAVVHRNVRGYRQNGTAWAYIGRDISYRMAGKSGTAQVVEIRQGEEYNEEELDEYRRKHAWFVAFAPADKPLLALAVLVENGGGGSSVAAPVAREIMDAYLLPQLASLGRAP
ncbi:MAG: penicillin-binding protein 2 [Pseudomonadota bacterium]